MNEQKRSNNLLEQFHSFLESIYGPNLVSDLKHERVTHTTDTLLTPQEREIQLIEWMNHVLQQQKNATNVENGVTDWKETLSLAWRFAVDADKTESSPQKDWLIQQLQSFSTELSRPAHLIYIQLINKQESQETARTHDAKQNVVPPDQDDWMELISEIANTESERCLVIPLGHTSAGVHILSDPDTDPNQGLDLIIEECKAWLDVLLGELYLDATIGIGSFVQSPDQVLAAMCHAIEVCRIGDRLYGSHGVYSYERFALQRMLYDVASRKLVDREQLLSQRNYELLGHELRDTALSFFRNQLNISETARVLYLHRNSLLYRLDKIRDITGYDIRKFEDAVALWTGLNLWRMIS